MLYTVQLYSELQWSLLIDVCVESFEEEFSPTMVLQASIIILALFQLSIHLNHNLQCVATIMHTLFGRNPAGTGRGTTGRGSHVINSSSPVQYFGEGVITEALLYVGSCVGGARHPRKVVVSLSPKFF